MSAQVIEGRKSTNRRVISLLPWLFFALIVALGGAAELLLFANQQGAGSESVASLYGDLFHPIDAIVTGFVGALIAARRSRNPIGWVLLEIAASLAASDTSGSYAVYALITRPGALPIALWAAWVTQWIWIGQFTGLFFILLVYPTGNLLSRRWRLIAYAGIVIIAVFALLNVLSPEVSIGNGPSPLTFASPIGVSDIEGMLPPAIFPGILVGLVGILFAALASLVIRFRRARGDERQQLKWFTYAAALGVATIPFNIIVGFWAQTVAVWAQTVSNIVFLALPLAVGVAIFKYRLYEIDLLINRTLVYVPLTAILAGVFAASITLSQKLFIAITGTTSDAATVLTTLIVVAAFDPLKSGLQHFVDRRFKETPDPMKQLKAYGNQVDSIVHVLRADESARRLLEEAMKAFDATSGAVFLMQHGKMGMVQHRGVSTDKYALSVPLVSDGRKFGLLSLGVRKNGMEYSEGERATVQQIANSVAAAIALTERMDGGKE